PEAMLVLLEHLTTPEAFWNTIADWVSADHLLRRRTYYDARFVLERIPEDHQLFWLVNEFYADACCQDDPMRLSVGRPPLVQCPFPSRVAFDELLAGIDTLDDWPHEALRSFTGSDY